MGDAPAPLKISKFNKEHHDRSQFTCGFKPIDNFLKKSLSDHVRSGMVAAYIATEERSKLVLGFYTLGALSVRADIGPKAWDRARIPDIPVIYIRAVAVHQTWQGRGLGTALVVDALKRCCEIADQMGAAAVVLDVLRDAHFDRRLAFYKNLGFAPLEDPGNPDRVFISLPDIRASLQSSR